MAEIRVQVAFHFTFDPAKELAKVPEEITKTIAVGDELVTEKIQSTCVGEGTRKVMLPLMEQLVLAAQKKAKPAKKEAPKVEVPEETGAQGSLL